MKSIYRQAFDKVKWWLLQENRDPRGASRLEVPDVVAYYWDGSAPEPRVLRDISATGAYLYTPERWYLGTIVRIVFQVYNTPPDGATIPGASICVPAQVVRHGSDGVAVEFAFSNEEERERFQRFLVAIPGQAVRSVLPVVTSRRGGQALIEFALIIPLVFILAVNAANFGGFLFAWITVANAARAGAQYMIMSSASPGQPTPANLTQITALVTSDVSSLPNRASIVVAICTNTNGTQVPPGCTSLSDPEPSSYVLATVDVTYTYQPFISLFSFPSLGISATLPSGTIHRKAVMRMLQ